MHNMSYNMYKTPLFYSNFYPNSLLRMWLYETVSFQIRHSALCIIKFVFFFYFISHIENLICLETVQKQLWLQNWASQQHGELYPPHKHLWQVQTPREFENTALSLPYSFLYFGEKFPFISHFYKETRVATVNLR